MQRKGNRPVWPSLAILIVLFVLVVASRVPRERATVDDCARLDRGPSITGVPHDTPVAFEPSPTCDATVVDERADAVSSGWSECLLVEMEGRAYAKHADYAIQRNQAGGQDRVDYVEESPHVSLLPAPSVPDTIAIENAAIENAAIENATIRSTELTDLHWGLAPADDVGTRASANATAPLMESSSFPSELAPATIDVGPPALEIAPIPTDVLPESLVWGTPPVSMSGVLPLGVEATGWSGFETLPVRMPVAASSAEAEVVPLDARLDWMTPESLIDRMDALSWDCLVGLWAREVSRSLRQLDRAVRSGEVEGVLWADYLERLVKYGDQLADHLGGDSRAAEVRRARHALERRLVAWRMIRPVGPFFAAAADSVRDDLVETGSDSGDTLASDSPDSDMVEVRPWKPLLNLRQMARGETIDPDDRVRLRERLREWLRHPPEEDWLGGAQDLGSERVPVVALNDPLLTHLERFERFGKPGAARQIALDLEQMTKSARPEQRELAEYLWMHYRNANLRVSVSDELLGRFMPDQEPRFQWVNDNVLGQPVHGRSIVNTDVGIRLVPDPHQLRAALEINGLISSLTTASTGPATFHNDSRATYRAWKEVRMTTAGIDVMPAEVAVNGNLRLRSLQTDFDGVPLFGPLVQDIARSRHEENRRQANQEMQRKVWRQAKGQIDSETDERLGALNARFRARVLEPLRVMGLEPEMIESQTTEHRMTARLRLAAINQLGSYTPRPRAPVGSLLSIQVHQSAIENFVEKLALDGKMFTIEELRDHFAERLDRPEIRETEIPEESRDVTITFATEDSVTVRFDSGRVVVSLIVSRLAKGGRAWRDFEVRALYHPVVDGLNAELVRTEVVQVIARSRDGIALRGIFSKVFSRNQRIPLTPKPLVDDLRMIGLVVTQLAIRDGWLGLAVGRPVAKVARVQQ